jgi:hypothetical protein
LQAVRGVDAGGRFYELNFVTRVTGPLFGAAECNPTTGDCGGYFKGRKLKMDSKITGMTMKGGAPNKGGTRILAFFDCETQDIGFKGAALVLYEEGKWGIWPPKIEDATRAEIHARRRYVFFRGDAFEKALLPAARELYWALGGAEGRTSRVAEGPAAEEPDHSALTRWLAGAA